MSNYNSLKTTIDANIKQNGVQAITGQILNSVLNAMVTTLGAGYQFAGVATTATNPGSPDAKVFYIANGKGTYTNFGGVEVTEDDVVVLYWDSSWHKVQTGIASQDNLSEIQEILDGTPSSPTILPSEGYVTQCYTDFVLNTLTLGNSYFDKRTLVPSGKVISNLSVALKLSGKFRFIIIDATSYAIIDEIEKDGVTGINNYDVNLSYNTDVYVGIKGGTTSSVSKNNYASGVYFNITSGTPVAMTYMVAIGVTYLNYAGGLIDQVEKLSIVGGVSDVSDINNLLAHSDVVTLAPRDYLVTTPVILTSGKTLRGSFGKTRLILSDGCTTAIQASNANDIQISDIEIVGTCPNYSYDMNGVIAGSGYNLVETESNALALDYMGNEKGIYLYYCENVALNNIKINHINGSAIRVNHTGRDYIKGLNATNLFITNCYNGIYTENEHEFSQYTNISITLCMIGIHVTSGNLVFSCGHITRCRVGMQLVDGYNTAHGIVNGIEFKHNQIAGIIANGVTVGEYFTGCYVTYCNIIIRNCSAICFDCLMVGRCDLVCTNDLGATGKNYIGKYVVRTNSTITNTGNLEIGERVNLY